MDEQEQGEVIKLDGSLGVGQACYLTVITKDEVVGEKEETFLMPYALLSWKTLEHLVTMRFINGIKIVMKPKETQ